MEWIPVSEKQPDKDGRGMPNPELVTTIVETENGINAKTFKNLDDLWNDLNV